MQEHVPLTFDQVMMLLGIKTAQGFAANQQLRELQGKTNKAIAARDQAIAGNGIIDAEVTRLRALLDATPKAPTGNTMTSEDVVNVELVEQLIDDVYAKPELEAPPG